MEAAIVKFTTLLGVEPVIGGRHLKWGSWNALFSLDNGTYFELLADDPNSCYSSIKHEGFLKDLARHKPNGEGIITYMYRPPQKYSKKLKDFKSIVYERAEYDAGSIFGGERALNDGQLLKWDLLCPLKENEIYDESKGVIGICIDWKFYNFRIHPSYTTPSGCTLLSFTCTHPNSENINKLLTAQNLETERFKLVHGDAVGFNVKLSTPNGIINISD